MTRALVLALTVAVGGAVADDKAERAGGPADLVGTYTIVGGEKDGKKIPDEEFKGAVVVPPPTRPTRRPSPCG
jgi:hypothetical protein